MRIQHNIAAMSSYRNYTNNVSAVNKNLEKLSSGYKINRAGDDAAGLAISEKMRAQISGLEAAQKNAKDGISLVQTAEGALTEVHDMLNRMVTLATQSANGTYDNETDREQLQKEMDQLKAEIDRIADSSNFNGIQLLDGSMDTTLKTTGETDLTKIEDALTTIADGQLGNTPQAGVFELDLSNFEGTVSSTGANTGVTVKIFGQTVTIATGLTQGDTLTGEDIAKAIAENFGGTGKDTADITAYGVKMTAEQNGSKVTFTMDKAPSKAWDQYASITDDSNTNSGSAATMVKFTGLTSPLTNVSGNQAQDVQVRTLVEPVDSSAGRLYAQAYIDLSKLSIEDGSTLTIGDTTYTFALGRNSSYKDLDNVIDLTDISEFDSTDKAQLGKIASRITTAAQNNANFKVTANSAMGSTNAQGFVYLTEKEGGVDTTNYKLEGTTNDTDDMDTCTDGDWSGLVKFGKVNTSAMGTALTLQIGDTSDSYNQLKVSISDCHVDAIGIGSIDISTQTGAQAAVDAIKNAINYVSDVRGTLGATQNRLEHTINNLSVMTENIQDAESTIRDTDIAEEMMAYTKNNILVQSAQAMLAQANQIPQGVLQLLG